MVQKNSSIELRVISGEEEARLSYLAAIANLPRSDGQIAVFDTGGGSTEFIFGRNNTIERRFSIDIAAVRLTETYFRHDPPAQFEINAVLSEIRQCFLKNGLSGTPDIVVGVGGAVTNIAGVMLSLPVYDSRRVNGAVITVDEIDRQISLYSSKKLVHRRKITGLAPQRADIILAGACILKVVAEFLNAEKITAVSSGLRHGVVYDLLSEEKAVL